MAWITFDKTKRKPHLVRWKEGKNRRQEGFATKAEAEVFKAQKTIEAAKRGDKVRRPRDYETPDFKTVAESFLTEKKFPRRGDPLEAKTLQGYRSYLDTWVIPVIGSVLITSISTQHYENVYDTAVIAGSARKTKKEMLRVMKAVLKYAKKADLIAEIPSHDIQTAPTNREKTRERTEREEKTYTPDEVYTMLAAADSLATDTNLQIKGVWQRYRPLTYFLVFTGARIGEARAFRRQDFDLTSNLIKIRQAAPESGPAGLVKTADGVRDIPIHPRLREVMEGYLRTHKLELVFGTATDNPMSHGNVHRRMLEPLKLRADALASQNIDPRFIRVSRNRAFHAFRHHYASRLVENGADLLTLKTYMGHASAAFTLDIYAHLFRGSNDEVVTGLVI